MGKRISIEDVDGAISSVEEAQAVMLRMADLGRSDEDFVLVVTGYCYYEMLKLNTVDVGLPMTCQEASRYNPTPSNDQLITGLSLGILLG
ncbi:hypothetical protein [Vibrio phage VpKK5]|uniref:hypothetical protein n=1 Tax=Vibrio phage VpKK5 TaxID=1538804 RepID=UPI0004F5E186|nr:hypothetical protein VC55_gp66 [Vibrio phage VpKK5]AIM40569.1 hypothetical protein [Vibrio phage VpKK5]